MLTRDLGENVKGRGVQPTRDIIRQKLVEILDDTFSEADLRKNGIGRTGLRKSRKAKKWKQTHEDAIKPRPRGNLSKKMPKEDKTWFYNYYCSSEVSRPAANLMVRKAANDDTKVPALILKKPLNQTIRACPRYKPKKKRGDATENEESCSEGSESSDECEEKNSSNERKYGRTTIMNMRPYHVRLPRVCDGVCCICDDKANLIFLLKKRFPCQSTTKLAEHPYGLIGESTNFPIATELENHQDSANPWSIKRIENAIFDLRKLDTHTLARTIYRNREKKIMANWSGNFGRLIIDAKKPLEGGGGGYKRTDKSFFVNGF